MAKNSYDLSDVVVSRGLHTIAVGLAEYHGTDATTVVDALIFGKANGYGVIDTAPRLVVSNSSCLDGDEWFTWACKWLERKHAESAAALKVAEDVMALSKARNDMFEAMLADVDRNTST